MNLTFRHPGEEPSEDATDTGPETKTTNGKA